MKRILPITVAIIVAHADDETLWAGGTLLGNPGWLSTVVCLCRGSDEERAGKFFNALRILNVEGVIGDLNDGTDQLPLDEKELRDVLLGLLPPKQYNLVISHSPLGKYTRHLRHEEIGRAVIELWHAAEITANELWVFAYEDVNRSYVPRPAEKASEYRILTNKELRKKYNIITRTYGFNGNSWEAKTTPGTEAFRKFTDSADAMIWLRQSSDNS